MEAEIVQVVVGLEKRGYFCNGTSSVLSGGGPGWSYTFGSMNSTSSHGSGARLRKEHRLKRGYGLAGSPLACQSLEVGLRRSY